MQKQTLDVMPHTGTASRTGRTRGKNSRPPSAVRSEKAYSAVVFRRIILYFPPQALEAGNHR